MPNKKLKYKVWLHLEVMQIDDDGIEQHTDGDEIVLPLPVAVVDSWKEAEKIMEKISNEYYG